MGGSTNGNTALTLVDLEVAEKYFRLPLLTAFRWSRSTQADNARQAYIQCARDVTAQKDSSLTKHHDNNQHCLQSS